MGMSYRRAWLLTDEVNRMFAEPVFATKLGGKGGGKAQLTEFGRSLVDLYRRMERRTEEDFGSDICRLQAALAPAAPPAGAAGEDA
jgi:molybdate transport system regulatory protein